MMVRAGRVAFIRPHSGHMPNTTAALPSSCALAAAAEGGEVRVRTDRITALVEHPVLIEPPAEAPPPPPQPLKLTKRELKKLRTQVGGAYRAWA